MKANGHGRGYAEFLEAKAHLGTNDGFEPIRIPDFLFDFQKHLVDWAIRKRRCALLEDCGLGKTPQQLVWAQNIVEKTNKPVLILTPLAVSYQHIAEAAKFGIEVCRAQPGAIPKCINITNYERLEHFDPNDFAGCVCDESSILKSFDGVRRSQITEFMKKMRYRSLWTATPAPNDYIELGTSSEALGHLGYTDMLQRFFKNDQNTVKPMMIRRGSSDHISPYEKVKWRFKGHAETPFWKWVCSWARALRRPSDIGFNDNGFVLPPLIEMQHEVAVSKTRNGELFHSPAIGLQAQREERRNSLAERCDKVAELVEDNLGQSLIWCHLNDEGDRLAEIVPESKQVSGSDSEERKEELLVAFASGQLRRLITKPKIAGFGMNFQNCAHITFFPSHSFEQYYQGVRRCWRFGQKNPVCVDIVTTEGEQSVLKNMQRKSKAADVLFSGLAKFMDQAVHLQADSIFNQKEQVPSWL